ncbi:hypothetical protein AALP_AAs45999U000300 [Arabis alpina]|uniref:Uncharacterized protein n=1 Tax=Arabis alpina TaxID=50452 RepID=A0A087G0L8_ARAAL|nr:hypothetical protein AALP_AAs45999U000300 [Arabis alpina]
MGLDENQLCGDLMCNWVLEHPHASICTSEGVNQFSSIDYYAVPRTQKIKSKLMEKTRYNKYKFDHDRIGISGGATYAHETVAFYLANPSRDFRVDPI